MIFKSGEALGISGSVANILSNGRAPLHMAAEKGDLDAIKNILKICGGNVRVTDDHWATPLHYAAHSGSIDAITVLLKAGSVSNAQDNDGDTPLRWALQAGNFEAVKYLIKDVAKMSIKNQDGRTAIHFAQSPEILKFLLLSGADINAADNYQFTPLQMAASAGDIERENY